MKKLLLLTAACASMLMSCKDVAAITEEAKKLKDLAKEKNVTVPVSVDSLITAAEKQGGDMGQILAEEAYLLLALALQKNEKECMEDSLKIAQETLGKYRKTYESRKKVRINAKEVL